MQTAAETIADLPATKAQDIRAMLGVTAAATPAVHAALPAAHTAVALVDHVPSVYDAAGLAFKAGDVVELLDTSDAARWKGRIGAKVGVFPSSLVETGTGARPPQPALAVPFRPPTISASTVPAPPVRGAWRAQPAAAPDARGSNPFFDDADEAGADDNGVEAAAAALFFASSGSVSSARASKTAASVLPPAIAAEIAAAARAVAEDMSASPCEPCGLKGSYGFVLNHVVRICIKERPCLLG